MGKQPDAGGSAAGIFLQQLNSKLADISNSDRELTKILGDHILQMTPDTHCVAGARNAIKQLAESRAKKSSAGE